MTQRIFDIENEKDMADLWDIVPISIIRIRKNETRNTFWSEMSFQVIPSGFIQINWHDKTEIIRPIQEATEADIGKLCKFWDKDGCYYGVLTNVGDYKYKYQMNNNSTWLHCRRLTKQEIEELC